MAVLILEGLWEEVATRALPGDPSVRVTFSEDAARLTVVDTTREGGGTESVEEWFEKLRHFSASHTPPVGTIDVDRDRIFRELHDDRG